MNEADDRPSLPPDEITRLTSEAIEHADHCIAAAIAIRQPSFHELFGALDDAARLVAVAYGKGAFLNLVAPDAAVRQAADDATERIEKWRADIPQRTDVAAAIAEFGASMDAASLSPDEIAYVRRWQADVRASGNGLAPDDGAEVRAAFDRLIELQTAFNANLIPMEHLELTRDELDGVADAIVASLPPGTAPDTLDAPMDESVSVGILQRARRREVRERAVRARLNRGSPANREILDEAVGLRRRIAQLLGYRSWLELRIENLAAPDVAMIERFVDEMASRLQPVVREELEAIRTVLVAEPGAPADLVVEDWDWRYGEQLQLAAIGAGPDDLDAYLELETVVAGLAALSDTVFGIHLVERPERTGWHPDVRAYDLEDRDTGSVVARVFFDLLAREGKAGNAFAVSLDPGVRGPAGPTAPPTLALTASAPAVSEGPSLLSTTDIETLFHEYGHVLDFALEPSPFVIHRPEQWIPMDWVEGPSGFLGRWGRHPTVLAEFARHHVTGARIPAALLEALERAESLNTATKMLRFLSMARLDILLHGEEPVSVDDGLRQTWAIRGTRLPDGTCEPAGIPHFMVGYDCAIYGFVWATVLSDDLLSRFEAEGLTSSSTGMAYRRSILEAPWTDDVLAGHETFMGRPWATDAFLARVTAADL
jgi:Zn-dependent oligopeptidase